MPDLTSAPLLHITTTGSTNEDLLSRARAGEIGPLWLRADRQERGRGRLGRAWSSPPGNLHISLLLPDVAAEPRFMPQLAHVAGVALATAVDLVTGTDGAFRLKWPNDLLHGSAKVAGILVEGTRAPGGRPVCVIGWGVNCIHHPEDLPYEATNLSAACGRRVTADTLAGALRVSMHEAVTVWRGGLSYAAIRQAWLSHCMPIGSAVSVRIGADLRQGIFAGLDEDGRFLLRTPTGLVPVEAGDINLQGGTAAPVG